MTHVFTYGSLMFARVWSGVVEGIYAAAPATLSGFRRQRVLGQDYPSLRRAEADGGDVRSDAGVDESVVDGVVYLAVQPGDLAALDAFEGPEYCRIQVEVTTRARVAGGPAAGSPLLADTYLFIAADQVEAGPWDPQEFERERIERFLRSFPPPR